MPKIVVTPAQLGPALRRHVRKRMREAEQVALNVAHRAQAEAVRLTTAARLVDQGGYRRSFVVRRVPGGAELRNLAPYAGVLELGRRPGATPPPVAVLEAWARRKLGLQPKEAKAAAFAIRKAISRRGLPPHHIMRRTARQAMRWYVADLRRMLRGR